MKELDYLGHVNRLTGQQGFEQINEGDSTAYSII
jgi:hypothetical protein